MVMILWVVTWESKAFLTIYCAVFVLSLESTQEPTLVGVHTSFIRLADDVTRRTYETFFSSTVLAPPQISASSPSNDSIVVSWTPVAHAIQYTLSIYNFVMNTEMKYNTSNTSLTFTGLDAGSLYGVGGFAWDPEGQNGEGSLYVNQTTRKEILRRLLVCDFTLSANVLTSGLITESMHTYLH